MAQQTGKNKQGNSQETPDNNQNQPAPNQQDNQWHQHQDSSKRGSGKSDNTGRELPANQPKRRAS